MTETRRLLEAAAALSLLLRDHNVPHAFYGNVLNSILTKAPQGDEMLCIVEGGHHHPFRRVRDALSTHAAMEDFTTTHSPWTNRLHVTYTRPIPGISIEILSAGETGPRRLDASTTMRVHGLPFLSFSEFIRAKLKAWMIRGSEHDAADVVYMLSRYWDCVDFNRINEGDMQVFVERYSAAASGWDSLRKKYGA